MIHRIIYIGRWRCDFFFATKGMDDISSVMECLEDMGASERRLYECWRKMKIGGPDGGFTYSRSDRMRTCISIGPTTSGAEFLDSFTHELRHVADDIATYTGIDLRGEEVAYITGDTTRELAEVVCRLGCSHCHD